MNNQYQKPYGATLKKSAKLTKTFDRVLRGFCAPKSDDRKCLQTPYYDEVTPGQPLYVATNGKALITVDAELVGNLLLEGKGSTRCKIGVTPEAIPTPEGERVYADQWRRTLPTPGSTRGCTIKSLFLGECPIWNSKSIFTLYKETDICIQPELLEPLRLLNIEWNVEVWDGSGIVLTSQERNSEDRPLVYVVVLAVRGVGATQ